MTLRLRLLRLLLGRRRRRGTKPLAGVAVSLLIHTLLIGALFYVSGPEPIRMKQGDALLVELPAPEVPPPKGDPSAPQMGPRSAPAAPAHPRPAAPRPAAPRPAAPKPAPPIVAAKPAPTPDTPAPARPAPEPPAPAPPAPVTPPLPAPEPARTAAAPPREPDPVPSPRAPEPPPAPKVADDPRPAPAPPRTAAAPTPPPSAERPAPPLSGPSDRTVSPTSPPPGPSDRSAPPPSSATSGTRVAAIPTPPPAPPAPDIRSALRRGGGGGVRGSEDGRGGIEGEAVPLDSPDPKYSDYLGRVRRLIQAKWGFPCAEGNPYERDCVRREGQLVIEFGIAKDGHVPFVNLLRSSGSVNMDDFAANAVKLASPFPPVPDSISKKGVPITATFRYLVSDGLTNLLR